MKSTQNPFSLYDFLGYLIPGATFLYMIIFYNHNLSIECSLKYLKTYDSIGIFFPFTICSYISGHLLSFLSSYTIEKYAVWKYGYPSKFLMGTENKSNDQKSEDTSKDETDTTEKDLKETPNNRKRNFIIKSILYLLILPVSIIDFVFGSILGFNFWNNRTLDNLSINLIYAKGSQIYSKLFDGTDKEFHLPNETIKPQEVDFFTVLHHYTAERTKTHNVKFQNYVALYGFLRCMTLILIIFFWVNVYYFLKNNLQLVSIESYLKTSLLIFLPYFFFLSFLKFYKRYSLETLMAMVTLDIDFKIDAKENSNK
jgi:hypothetical protein